MSHYVVNRWRHTRQIRLRLVMSLTALLVGVILGAAVQGQAFLIAVAGAAYLVYYLQAPQRAIRRAVSVPGEYGNRSLWVVDDGLVVESQLRTTLYKWNGISGTSELNGVLTICRGRDPLLIIPAGAFVDEDNRNQFVRLIRERSAYRVS